MRSDRGATARPAAARFSPPAGSGDWERVAPAAVGWDEDRLAAALAFAGQKHSSGMVILHGGRIMAEEYWGGATAATRGDTASVQKSMVSVLVGVAAHDGHLRLPAPVSEYLGRGWTKAPWEAEQRITVRHLLTMTAGLDESLGYLSDAGTVWCYNTPAYQMVKAVLAQAVNERIEEYTEQRLLGPLGMCDSGWVPRKNQYMADGATLMTGMMTTPRDMARFGLMVLNNGLWDGNDIVHDQHYLRDALNPSQPLNPSYGYLWWLNGQAQTLDVPEGSRGYGGFGGVKRDGPLMPTAPADLVAALGHGDKKIYVVPSLDLVVTRFGEAADSPAGGALSRFDDELWRRLMAAAPEAAR